MPRAADRYPDRRGGNDLHSPLRGLLDFTTPLAMTAQAAGDGIRKKIEDVVAYIKETTGIDLTGFTDLLNGLEAATGLNLFELADLNLTDNIPQLIAALQGIDWSQPGAILQAIEDVAAAVPIIGPLLSALIGQAIPDDADPLGFAQTWGDNLRSILPGIDLNLPTAEFDPQTALANFVNDGLRPLRLLLGIGDPLPARDLVGSILPHLLTFVPNTSIGRGSPNLVPDPSFQDGAALAAIDDDKITPDPTVGRTTAGSARIECDGNKHEILSDPATPVSPGQTIPFEAYARWQNLTTGASPVQLGVATYDAAGQYIGTTNLGVGGAAGTQLTFQKVTGPTYTVPEGVAYVRQSLAVMPTATSGFVWLDDADHHKTQLWPTSFTAGLPDALTGLWNGLGEAGDNLLDLIETLAGGAGGLTAIVNRFIHIGGTGLIDLPAIPILPVNLIDGLDDELAEIGDAAADAVEGLNTLINDLATNPAGTLGALTGSVIDGIGTTLGGFLNLLRNGLTGGNASSSNAADVAAAANTVAGTATNAVNAAQTATALATYAGGRALWESANPTIDATMLESSLGTGSNPTYFTVSQTASAMGFIRTRVAQDKTIVQWIGRGNSLTTAKLHVYRLNTTTGDVTWVQTKDIVPGTLPTATGFGRVIVQLDAAVHMEPGDVLALEVCVTGGNHDIAGLTIPWLTPDDSALPKGPGASRNSGTESAAPTTIAAANVPYGTRIPFIGAGIPQAELPPPSYAYYFTDTFNSLAAWTALPGGNFQANGGYAVNPTANPSFLLYNNSSYSDKTAAGFTTAPIAVGTIAGFNNGSYIRYFMHANAACTQGVGFELASNGSTATPRASIALVTLVGGVRTVRATTTVQWTLETKKYFRISYDPATKTYSTNIAGLSWTDSGNEIQHGPDYRRIAIFSDFAMVNNPGAQYSGVCADILFYDIT